MTALALRLTHSMRRPDPVVAALLAGLGLMVLIAPAAAWRSATFTLASLGDIAPFLLLSIALGAYVKAAGADRMIATALGGRAALMIVVAALFGALSPFCSCGVIPLIAALLAMGMPLAAVMAFWIASPIMDPQMFVLTAAGLGLEFAAAKTTGAVAMGLASGFATLGLERLGLLAEPLRPYRGCRATGLADGARVGWAVWRDPARRRRFVEEARATGLFLVKWLALAFWVESLMIAYLPADAIGRWLGGDSLWAIPAAVVAGVPAYLNGYAAIPTVAALLELGMAPGAGLAFMTAGGVTSLPAALAVFAVVRRPVFLWYLTLALAGSAVVGYGFQLWVSV